MSRLLSPQHISSPQFQLGEYSSSSTSSVASSTIPRPVFALPFLSSSRSADKEKISAYECGSSPFDDARNQFDVRYYSVAILSIIPDPEVSFLFPWAVTPNKITVFGFWSMFVFLFIPTVGSFYEWKKGALEWE